MFIYFKKYIGLYMCINIFTKFIQRYTKNNNITINNNVLYYKIIQNIHNCTTLSDEQKIFINTLPNKNLIELILIYDIDIKKFNNLIELIN